MAQMTREKMATDGPMFSKLVQGYWRLNDWQMTSQQCLSFLKQHIELGITTVDHAHLYGNPSCEQQFGDALKHDSSIRQQIEIVTKCGIELTSLNKTATVNHYDSSKATILNSVDISLTRLGTDYIDVLLLHRPDYLLNADDVASAFEELRATGKVRHFGVSNFTIPQMALLQSRLDFSLVTNQIEINPLNLPILDSGILEFLQQQRIKPMAWSCLAGGRLFSEHTEQTKRLRDVLSNIALEVNAQSIEQVLFAWVMKLPSQPVPIIGSGKIERVQCAVDALSLQLSQDQWYRIWVAAKGHGVP